MKKLATLVTTVLIIFAGQLKGQVSSSQKIWEYTPKRSYTANVGDTSIKTKIAQIWDSYAFGNSINNPIKTSFDVYHNQVYRFGDNTTKQLTLKNFDNLVGKPVTYFEDEVEFGQKISLKTKNGNIRGAIQFMQCSDQVRVLPQDFGFSLKIFN